VAVTTSNPNAPDPSNDTAAWSAIGELYHRFLTGLVLALVSRQGTARATEVVYRTFRRQHLELFLPGLTKLGLDGLPPAVACAQYHVLSNALGGVRVEWIPESETKSWVRYLPPRWIFDGTALCGVPTEVSRAMLRGWHGHNGQSLGNDHLGFVATMQTTDGQPGLEGYYIEEDSPLALDDRVRFRPGERPAAAPEPLPNPTWSDERLAKVERNYSVAYVRSILPEMAAVLGPADAAAVGRIAGRQIGMQFHSAVMAQLAGGGAPFEQRFARLLAAHGSRVAVESDGRLVRLVRSELFESHAAPSIFEAWNGVWEGMAAMEGLRPMVTERLDLGDPSTIWEFRSL